MQLVAPLGASGQVLGKSGALYTISAAGTLQVPNSSGDISPLQGAGFTPVHPVLPWATGRFFCGNVGDTLAAGITLTGIISAYPIYIPGRVNILTAGFLVTTLQAGSSGRLGLYLDNGGTPVGGALVAGSDQAAIATTSNAVLSNTYTTPIQLEQGWYWVATTFTSGGTFPTVSGISAANASGTSINLGGDTAVHAATGAAANRLTGYSATFTPFAALPALFPSLGFASTVNANTPAVVFGT